MKRLALFRCNSWFVWGGILNSNCKKSLNFIFGSRRRKNKSACGSSSKEREIVCVKRSGAVDFFIVSVAALSDRGGRFTMTTCTDMQVLIHPPHTENEKCFEACEETHPRTTSTPSTVASLHPHIRVGIRLLRMFFLLPPWYDILVSDPSTYATHSCEGRFVTNYKRSLKHLNNFMFSILILSTVRTFLVCYLPPPV